MITGYKTAVICSILFFFILLTPPAYPQRHYHSDAKEISIPFISSKIVPFTYERFSPYACILRTTSKIPVDNNTPAGEYEVINDWKYVISLTLKIKGEDLVWNTPVNAVLTYQDGTRESVIINKETSPLYWYNFYNFDFDIHYRKKGWVTIDLYPLKEWDNLNAANVKFTGTKFRLE